MIPKIDCCLTALEGGVPRTHIIDGRVPHSLLIEMFSDRGIGTMIYQFELAVWAASAIWMASAVQSASAVWVTQRTALFFCGWLGVYAIVRLGLCGQIFHRGQLLYREQTALY